MIDPEAVLGRSRLTVVSAEPDDGLAELSHHIMHSVTADGPDALGRLFERLLDAAGRGRVAPKSLDLIGHARTSASLLALGDWVIDGGDPATLAWLDDLARRDVLPRLGIHTLRLLGCHTAGTDAARSTVTTLAERLSVEVWGTTGLLYRAHYGPDGFLEPWSFLLVSASELREAAREAAPGPAAAPGPRVLDVGALPVVVLGPGGGGEPRRIADREAAARILSLVQHDGGARIGAPAVPMCELALAAASGDGYHIAHVVFDGAFVELSPDGAGSPRIAFPVRDPGALRQIIATLPRAPVTR
ncbi:MAG TPA: hypothetical protein VFT22_31020 [Kofleriaceae bacterium]|nr:hypothetical protein [Kofleriaceae bacterium]